MLLDLATHSGFEWFRKYHSDKITNPLKLVCRRRAQESYKDFPVAVVYWADGRIINAHGTRRIVYRLHYGLPVFGLVVSYETAKELIDWRDFNDASRGAIHT